MEHYIGVEIGGTKLQIVLGDEQANILKRQNHSVDPTKGADAIRQQIERSLPELVGHREIIAVGIGFGGPVDWRTGKACRSHQVEGWSGFDLAAWMESLTHAPVFVDNDGNVAALAEAELGAGLDHNPVFYVTLGSGVGGGLIEDGRIYHGALPGESEIGHIRLNRSGRTVESSCSGWAMDARVRAVRVNEPGSVLCRLMGSHEGGEARHLAPALEHDDEAAKRILREMSGDLALGLSHAVHLFHPEVIVLGGGLTAIGEPLRKAVEEELRPLVMEAFAPGPRVFLSALREDVVPIGALLLANRS